MTLNSLRAEIKRLSMIAGLHDDEVLVVLAAVTGDADQLDLPDTVGHIVHHPINGKIVALYFLLRDMTSIQAAELALAIILHTRKTERLSRHTRAAIMDMQPFPTSAAWIVEPVPNGVSVEDHAVCLYRQISEARQ